MTKVYDLEETKALLDEIVAEFGADYVYQKPSPFLCRYRKNSGEPDCIVGQLLAKVGLLPDREFESRWGATYFLDPECKHPLTNLENNFTVEANLLLHNVQGKQDYETPWGQAVDEAWAFIQDQKELKA